MFISTVPSARTNATTSSHVTAASHSVKAGANSGCSPASRAFIDGAGADGPGPRASAPRRRHLDQDFVRLDHAQFIARLLLDHLEAFLQVAHLGGKLLVALARRIVRRLLRAQAIAELDRARHAALAKPELGMD